ncbi:MAG: lipocalin family protein [Aliarcobacter sp.]|nr:lipocalin family protein [Aliarcobacter sp.]
MKYLHLIFFFFSTIYANSSLKNDFDMKKFSGLWYEIARIENSFQTSCVASSVEYDLQKDNTYQVLNRCFDSSLDGKLIEYTGSAKKIEENQNIKLQMRYFYIFTSEYEVSYLNDYKIAVVTNDDYSNLWIMSRTPNIQKEELEKILNNLKNKMDTSKLVFTELDPKGRYK